MTIFALSRAATPVKLVFSGPLSKVDKVSWSCTLCPGLVRLHQQYGSFSVHIPVQLTAQFTSNTKVLV